MTLDQRTENRGSRMRRQSSSSAIQSALRYVAFDALPPFGLVMILLLLVALFSALRPTTFFTRLNLITIGGNQAIALILALAVLVPLVAGEFDLSVAANFGICQLLTIGLQTRDHFSIPATIATVIAVGSAIGLVNGLLIVGLKLDSFIATLGTGTILGGLLTGYSNGSEIPGVGLSHQFINIGEKYIWTVPVTVFYAIGVAFILWIVLAHLAFGNWLFATGNDRLAAREAGIATGRLIVTAFTACGAVAAIAGIVLAAQLGSGEPTIGPTYLLPAYAGCFLGATTIRPGRFNVWGTVVGLYLLGVGVAGLQELGFAPWITDVFNGGALVLAVAASSYFARHRARRERAASEELLSGDSVGRQPLGGGAVEYFVEEIERGATSGDT
jgi:ribose transport system permease protein